MRVSENAVVGMFRAYDGRPRRGGSGGPAIVPGERSYPIGLTMPFSFE